MKLQLQCCLLVRTALKSYKKVDLWSFIYFWWRRWSRCVVQHSKWVLERTGRVVQTYRLLVVVIKVQGKQRHYWFSFWWSFNEEKMQLVGIQPKARCIIHGSKHRSRIVCWLFFLLFLCSCDSLPPLRLLRTQKSAELFICLFVVFGFKAKTHTHTHIAAHFPS